MKKTRFAAGLLAGLLMLFSLSPAAMAAVYWGQRGDEVRQVQQKLKQWGYYSGSVDFRTKHLQRNRSLSKKEWADG